MVRQPYSFYEHAASHSRYRYSLSLAGVRFSFLRAGWLYTVLSVGGGHCSDSFVEIPAAVSFLMGGFCNACRLETGDTARLSTSLAILGRPLHRFSKAGPFFRASPKQTQ